MLLNPVAHGSTVWAWSIALRSTVILITFSTTFQHMSSSHSTKRFHGSILPVSINPVSSFVAFHESVTPTALGF
jgi:hypothetical protein